MVDARLLGLALPARPGAACARVVARFSRVAAAAAFLQRPLHPRIPLALGRRMRAQQPQPLAHHVLAVVVRCLLARRRCVGPLDERPHKKRPLLGLDPRRLLDRSARCLRLR
eukprot:712739-Pleurochrysis_carterae.AAC.2